MQSLGVQLENGGINDRLQESSSTEAGVSHFAWMIPFNVPPIVQQSPDYRD